jgi:hypothetical protein
LTVFRTAEREPLWDRFQPGKEPAHAPSPTVRIVIALTLVVALAASAVASAQPDRAVTTLAKKKRKAPRRGGHERAAWPANPHRPAPKRPLVRWLARQAGPERKVAEYLRQRFYVAPRAGTAGTLGRSTAPARRR